MNTQLQPVPFHHDTIFVIDHLGQPYVPLRPLVENMGLDWAAQFTKIKAKEERFCVAMIATQMPGDDQRREMVCIPLKKVNAWLYSIDSNKVAPHLKDKVELYQNDCDEVLHNFWFKGVGLPDRQLVGKMMVDSDKYVALLEENNQLLRQQVQGSTKKRVNFTPEEDATVLILRGQGLSYREIGLKIDRPAPSIRSCLYRLLAKGQRPVPSNQLPLFGGEV